MKQRGKNASFNQKPKAKAFFHMAEPFCSDFLRLKHESYEKSLKLYSLKNKDKENKPMYEFRKPKSGYYALKGCRVQSISKFQQKQKEEPQKQKSLFLNFFLRNYIQKRQKQHSFESQLPSLKHSQPYMYPSMQEHHMKSIVLQNITLNALSQQRRLKKLKTEPVERRKNRSCQNLQKEQLAQY